MKQWNQSYESSFEQRISHGCRQVVANLMDKSSSVTDSNESRSSEAARTLLSNSIATSKTKLMRVLDWEKTASTAEMYVDAIRKKQGIIAVKSNKQNSFVHEGGPGKDDFHLDKVSFYRIRNFYSHLTPIFHCCRDNCEPAFPKSYGIDSTIAVVLRPKLVNTSIHLIGLMVGLR